MTKDDLNEKYKQLREAGYKTIEELQIELRDGLRESYGYDEINKADKLQRALFPEGIVYPKDRDIYQVLEDTEVEYITLWKAPFTSGGSAILPRGERVKVNVSGNEPVCVDCKPLNSAMEKVLIPYRDRNAIGYNGYYLNISTLVLNSNFKIWTGLDL